MPFEVDVRDRIGEIVFDHPPVNAFDSSLWLELPGIIHGLAERKDVRCLLIRAEGRGFCAGVDIKELQANANRIVEVNRGNYLSFRAVHRCEVPVVTAPHGFVLGGGIGLCGASDAIVAADDAYFALPEIDRGAMGGAAHLQRIVPHAQVRAAFLTGGQITAEEAWRLRGAAGPPPPAGAALAGLVRDRAPRRHRAPRPPGRARGRRPGVCRRHRLEEPGCPAHRQAGPERHRTLRHRPSVPP